MDRYKTIMVLVLVFLTVVVLYSGTLEGSKFFQTKLTQAIDIYTDASCSRNGEVVTCTGSAQNYGACGSDYSKRYFGFCYKDGLGDNFPEWLQGRLGENYALTSEQRQSVYDNLRLSGSCRFGYEKGTLWGNANDPSYPSDACVYTYYFVDTLSDGSYSQISSCQNKQFGTCGSVPVDVNKCNLDYPQGWKSSPISIFFIPYSASGTFGSCTLTTNMAQSPPPPSCPATMSFDITKEYTAITQSSGKISVWQYYFINNLGCWYIYTPGEPSNLIISEEDYQKIVNPCQEVTTKACNPSTQEIRDYPNSCIPSGWTTNLIECGYCSNDADCNIGEKCIANKCVPYQEPCVDGDERFGTCQDGKEYLSQNCVNGKWENVTYVFDPCIPLCPVIDPPPCEGGNIIYTKGENNCMVPRCVMPPPPSNPFAALAKVFQSIANSIKGWFCSAFGWWC